MVIIAGEEESLLPAVKVNSTEQDRITPPARDLSTINIAKRTAMARGRACQFWKRKKIVVQPIKKYIVTICLF